MEIILLVIAVVVIRRGWRAMVRRLTPLARRLMPADDQFSAAEREAAAAVWRVLSAVFVTAGVMAGVTWYYMPAPLEPWMLAAYFAWGVIAFLILDHTLDRRLRSGWLRNTARLLLTACFAWTLVAPWRLLGRLSDWYFVERRPVRSFPVRSFPMFMLENDRSESCFNYDDDLTINPAYSFLSSNIHHEWRNI